LAKEDLLVLDGLIEEILPDGRFRVHLDNGARIIAHTGRKMRRFKERQVGDRVPVEMTPYTHCWRPAAPRQAPSARHTQTHARNGSCPKDIMNFRTNFPFKSVIQGASPLPRHRSAARKPAALGTTLSRGDFRRIVAEMID
jgi:translation initiation factor IF-1